jgi:1-acyl-sn-glycerol-3-phosphate acyltransferase
MLNRISRYWRIAGTASGFFFFGAGGLLMRVLVFPAINLFIWKRPLRIAAARNVIRFAFRAFVGLMSGLGVLRYQIKGLEKLERNGLLIVANHPTLIDTVFLMAFVKRADCIVRSGLWNNPFTHGPVRAAGYIKNEDGPRLLHACLRSLKDGNNLIIFPEGTRTPRDGILNFKRGAANIAARGMIDLTPVVIRCTPTTLGKGDKWWKVPHRRAHVSVEVQQDIKVEPFILTADTEALAARRLTEYMQNYFAEESTRHAVA